MRSAAVSRTAAVIVVIVVLLAATAGVYAVFLTGGNPTQTTSSTTVGNAVPNPNVFIEENTIQPGPGGLDPALTWDYSDMFFLNVYENLVRWNGPDPTTFVPWLASSWTIAPNASQVVFHLRQGITFQDGTPFNATAVKFSYDRAILINHEDGPEFLLSADFTMAIRGGPEYSSANTIHVTNTTEVQKYLAAGGVKVLDTYTVVFNFEHPYPEAATLGTFAWESGGSIVSPSYVIANCPGTTLTPGVTPGFECAFMQTHMMGTGPFMLQSYTPSSQIVFARYPNYWGTPSHTGPAKLSQYIVKYVPSVSTSELDLLSGAADAISLPTSNAFDLINKQIFASNGTIVSTHNAVRIWAAPTNTIATMLMNPRIHPFDDVNFRKAIAYAFPYQQFLQNVTNGFSLKLGGYLTPRMFGHDANIKGYNYDPTLAQQLFAKAGYTGSVTIIIESHDATNTEAAILFKQSVESLAPQITINIQAVDTPTSETLANWASPQGFTGLTTGFNNATVITWLNQAAASLNSTYRLELYSKVQKAMLDWAGIIPMYSPDAIQVERTWVLPSNSAIGRGVYNPQYGDGSGGAGGGYLAYYIQKANSTQFPIALSISMPGLLSAPSQISVMNAGLFGGVFLTPIAVRTVERESRR
ncbi:MAG: ABC transporter substrate-binding protein [Thaumarchaeota archaeon]|nr:MAG: ABC transporter substrate-binding protein [Nitrososphaerota archaeon]